MDEATSAPIITELLNGYASTTLPADVANSHAVNHEYLVDALKTDGCLPRNVAANVLCHVSVSKVVPRVGICQRIGGTPADRRNVRNVALVWSVTWHGAFLRV